MLLPIPCSGFLFWWVLLVLWSPPTLPSEKKALFVGLTRLDGPSKRHILYLMNFDEEPKGLAAQIVDGLSRLIELFDPKSLTKSQRFTLIWILIQLVSVVVVLELDLGAHRDTLVPVIVIVVYASNSGPSPA